MSLLVIGGGPAGAAAAITARQAGVDVTILDESRFPRFRPGETLHPGIEPLLAQLGAQTAIAQGDYLRHAGTWVHWASRNEFVAFGEDGQGAWRGFQTPREDLDGQLLSVARQLGVQVREQTMASSVLTSGRRVIGVETANSPVHAQFTIDASGGKHWLARRLHIPIVRHSPRLIARYGYVEGFLPVEKLPCIRSDASGWTWLADLSHRRLVWTRVTEPALRPPKTWVPEECQTMRALESRGADVTWRMAAQTAGDGWFLCGDAAAVLDPSSSHGVLRAIMTGIRAAHLAIAVLRSAITPREAAIAYHGWLRDWFRHDARKMAELYRQARLFGY